jgi:glutathione S-transferase
MTPASTPISTSQIDPLITTIMAQIHLDYEPGSCDLAPHALMRHLSIPFITHPESSFDTPPSDEDERERRLYKLCRQPPSFWLEIDSVHHHERRRRLYELCRQPPSLELGSDSVRHPFNTMPAVLTYIASRGRDPQQLLGRNELEKAIVAEWLAYLDGALHGRAFLMASAPEKFVEAENVDHDAIAARGRHYIERYFREIDGKLSGRNFAVGERFTVVEFYLYVFARWYETLYGDFGSQFPGYYRVMRSTENLQGVILAVGEQRLEFLFTRRQQLGGTS